MLHRLFITIISIVACIAVGAQETCTINGTITDCQLSDGGKIKKVYLTRTNEFGQTVTVAEAKVKKGRYTFKYKLSQNDPVLLHTITGFGEGKCIEVYIEPGVISINTPSAKQPCESTIGGTTTNETYSQYKTISRNAHKEVEKQVAALAERYGKEWLDGADGKKAVSKIESKESINTLSQMLRFLVDHNTSPMTPLEIERNLLHLLTPAYAEQITNSVSTLLHNHPYYHSLRNKMLAGKLKVGNEAPNITLPLLNGEKKQLSDYRGKYVVLNFIAANDDKSAAVIAELRNLYNVVKENSNQFVIITVSLDSDIEAWRNMINSNNLNLDAWLHACDGAGNSSPAAKLMGVEAAPRIILIEPEGRAVSLDMESDEVVMRVEQILSGDLYYLDQEE